MMLFVFLVSLAVGFAGGFYIAYSSGRDKLLRIAAELKNTEVHFAKDLSTAGIEVRSLATRIKSFL